MTIKFRIKKTGRKKNGTGRMNIESLDITMGRIRHIESKIGSMEQRFDRIMGNSQSQTKSFDDVLNKEITTLDNPKNVDRKNVNQLIEKYSQKNGLDTDLVKAVIQTESSFDSKAVSPAGAQGLMQLMPATAETLGVKDSFDPEQNIQGGTKYLRRLINQYDSVEKGLAAYNAGPEAVNKYGGVPPYQETQNYVRKVLESQ